MITYYLYVKTHNTTGLQYLGQTIRDPHKYIGSGIRWNRHLNVHGNDVSTIVIQKCYTKSALKSWGLYYSQLWSIVESKQWANLKPEEGQGGWGGDQNPNNHPIVKQLKSNRMKIYNPLYRPDVAKKHKSCCETAMRDPAIRKRHLAAVHSKKWKKSRAKRVGAKAPSYDSTVYTFKHKDGTIETCTQYDLRKKYGEKVNTTCLIHKKIKRSQGWQLI